MGISIQAQPQATASSLASATAIAVSFNQWFAQQPIAEYGTGTWDATQIQEHGNMVHDSVTGLWILPYTGEDASDFDHVGAVLSVDGNTWYAHPDNPLTGATNAEDPYIARTVTGEVYRDSDGKALMFCEEKVGTSSHRGINLFKSGANVLTGWTFFGRVLDRGTAGQWDESDRTSPIVIYDGSQLVMLYEGRSSALGGEAGSIGLATSADEGETWTVSGANPIIDRADIAWANAYIVPDDLIKVDSTWVLTIHGADTVGQSYSIGRLETTDDPGAWDDTSWSEMTGNPFTHVTNAFMCWKNDPRWAVVLTGPERQLLGCVIVAA